MNLDRIPLNAPVGDLIVIVMCYSADEDGAAGHGGYPPGTHSEQYNHKTCRVQITSERAASSQETFIGLGNSRRPIYCGLPGV